MHIHRIIDLEILHELGVVEPEDFTIADYVKTTVGMHDGEEQEVDFICDDNRMKCVIDGFGVGDTIKRREYQKLHLKQSFQFHQARHHMQGYLDLWDILQ